jgi:2-C-methyl-D-erythritol 2,4-cyclodiphosphate synthase
MRIGSGFDVHAFGPGDFIMLAGVRIPHTRGVVAHSDGDVVLHALCNALLGAAALGDIGMHFPDSDPQWRGAASTQFVSAVLQLLRARALAPANVDITIFAQVPLIAPHRAGLRASLASLLGLPQDRVNVKATTTEHLGFIGRAEGIAAQAVALVEELAGARAGPAI